MQEQPKQPAPEYVLVDTVVGKPKDIKRGPQVLKATWYEKNEKDEDIKKEIEFKVPIPPVANCKKCYGRGYIGFADVRTVMGPVKQVVTCKKCFPML